MALGAIQRMVRMTAAWHQLIDLFPNRTIASMERANAAKFHSLATAPTLIIHMYTLHRYCGGLRCSGPTTTSTTDVPTMKTTPNPMNRPATRRLTRKRRSGRGIDCALPSATIVIPITAEAARVTTIISTQ